MTVVAEDESSRESRDMLMRAWGAKLGEIRDGLTEATHEATEVAAERRRAQPFDLPGFAAELDGRDLIYERLYGQVQRAWDDEFAARFEAVARAAGGVFYTVGLDLKGDAELDLEAAWREWKTWQLASFFRKLAPLADEAVAEPRPCDECGAPLQLEHRDLTQVMDCEGCGTENSYVPPVAVLAMHHAPRAYALEQVAPLRSEIHRFQEELDRWRRDHDWQSPPRRFLEHWLSLERRYWTTYVQTVAQHTGAPPDLALAESRLDDFVRAKLNPESTW